MLALALLVLSEEVPLKLTERLVLMLVMFLLLLLLLLQLQLLVITKCWHGET